MYASPPFNGQRPYDRLIPDETITDGVLVRRVLAWLIDVAILSVLGSVLWVGLLLFGLLTLGLGMPLLLLLPTVPFFYGWFFIASPLSATPGQALLGLAVRRDEDLGPPGAARALAATAFFYLTLATTLGVFWFLVAFLTRRQRTLHDSLSGTVIVQSTALTTPGSAWNMRMGDWPSA